MIVENLELIFATSIWSVFIEKENTDLHEASILDLDIKIRYGKFQFHLFEIRVSFPFSNIRANASTNNMSSNIVYSPISPDESIRTASEINSTHSLKSTFKNNSYPHDWTDGFQLKQ